MPSASRSPVATSTPTSAQPGPSTAVGPSGVGIAAGSSGVGSNGTSASGVGGPVVAQRTGNAAAQERAGTTGPAPAPASCLDAAIDAMGDMAAVVLDALPLPQAFPLAWQRRGEGWAQRWIRSQPAPDVLRAAGDLVGRAFDFVWPVGLGFELDALVSAELLVEGAVAGALGVERAAEGLVVRFGGTVTPAAAVGLGLKTTGAGEEAVLGGDVEAKLGRTFGVELEWSLDVQDVLCAVAELRPGSLHDLLWGVVNPASLVADSLGKLMNAVPADKARLSDTVALEMGGEGAMGPAGDFSLNQRHEVGYAVGVEDGAVYAEARVGQSTTFATHNWLLARILPLADLGVAHGGELRVRAKGTSDQIAAQDTDALTYEVTTTRDTGIDAPGLDVRGRFQVEDTAILEGWDAFERYVAAVLDPADTLRGEEGAPVPAEHLPDVALNRGMQRDLGDLPAVKEVVPDVAERLQGAAGRLLGLADRATDHTFTDLDVSAELTGSVRVPVEAVQAAIGGGSLTPGPEGIEARVLDVARVIAAEVVGGTLYDPAMPELDTDAALAAVDIDGVEMLARAELRAATGVDVAFGVGIGTDVDAGAAVTWRTDFAELSTEEQRALLLA